MTATSGRGGPRDWDATTYDQVAAPMTRWGSDVLERLPLRGDETVLDAGCGTGQITERLVERLPRGRVVALDGSPAMVEAARGRLARFGERVDFVTADLAAPLPIADASVDAILSTATFHWVADHGALFRHLARVVAPGGRLVAQCGGEGNIVQLRVALDEVGDGWEGPWNFASPEETRRWLEAAGFVGIDTWLTDEPTSFEPGSAFRDYLRTVALSAHVARLEPEAQDDFLDAVIERLAEPAIHFVRLNIVAERGTAP
jgi:trans-aconitate 2-methyltransferase